MNTESCYCFALYVKGQKGVHSSMVKKKVTISKNYKNIVDACIVGMNQYSSESACHPNENVHPSTEYLL